MRYTVVHIHLKTKDIVFVMFGELISTLEPTE